MTRPCKYTWLVRRGCGFTKVYKGRREGLQRSDEREESGRWAGRESHILCEIMGHESTVGPHLYVGHALAQVSGLVEDCCHYWCGAPRDSPDRARAKVQ
eukprot:2890546-Pyramimonas_sp.AAC.1